MEVLREVREEGAVGMTDKLQFVYTSDCVPVVRCKDCKHYNTTGCGAGFGWCEDTVVNTGIWDDFYCADGERRDSE